MTTIAWDGKMLAADRQINAGGVARCTKTKIAKNKKGDLCGASGITSVTSAFLRWFLAGEKGPAPALKDGTDECEALIIRTNGAIIMYDSAGWHEVDPGFITSGSGWELALGALLAGKNAVEAVKIASMVDTKTSSEVDVLWLGKTNSPKYTIDGKVVNP